MPKQSKKGVRKVVKGWGIINKQKDLTNKQAEHFQYYLFRDKNPAVYLTWLWNKQCQEKKYKVVAIEVTYSLK